MTKTNLNQDQKTLAKSSSSSESDLNNNTSFAAQLQQGDALWKANQVESAIECYRQAAQLNPHNAVVHQKLAIALKHKGDLIGSLKSYHQAIEQGLISSLQGEREPSTREPRQSSGSAKVKVNSKSNIYATAKMNSHEFDSKLNHLPYQNLTFPSVAQTGLDQQRINHLPSPPSTIKIKSNPITNNSITHSLASVNLNPVTRNSAMMPAAELYLEQAKIFAQQQHWQGAIEACQQALAIAPNLAQAYKIWGNALQRAGQIPEALGCYARAITIDPNFVEVYANVGSLYASQEQWQEALKYYQKALEINPRFAGVYQNIAKVLNRLGRTQQALEYQYQAFRMEPASFDGVKHYQLGNQLLEIGKTAEAIICYRHAIKLAPDLIPAYQKLADTLEQQGQWEEAANFYQQLLKINAGQQEQTKQLTYTPERKALPQAKQQSAHSQVQQQLERYLALAKSKPDSPSIQANLGSLYAQQQKWTEALAAYQRAIRLDPQFAGAYRNLAKVYRQLNQDEQAARCWQKAIQLQPEAASGTEHLEVGKLLLKQKKKAALEHLKQAIELEPHLAEAYHLLGEVLLGSQTDAAIRVYRKALEQNPDDGLSWFGLGQSLALLSQIEQAIAAYRRAIELNPQHWQAYYSLGEVLSQAQRWQEAVNAYQKAIEIEPEFFWSYNNLGFALLNLNDWQSAVTTYTRAIGLKDDFSWSYYNLAEALLRLNRVEKAIIAYRKAQQYQPTIEGIEQKIQAAKSFTVKTELEQAYQAYRRAIAQNPQDWECYRRALQIQPQQTELYQQWARVLIEQQQQAEAIKVYQTALNRNPQWVEGYYQLAQLVESSSEIAMLALQNAIELQPQSATVEQYERLGEYLWEQQQYQQAQKLYQQALKFHPNVAIWYQRLGKVLAQQQNWSAAIEAYRTAVEIEATAEAYQSLGDIYLQLQQPEPASVYYNQALQLQPDLASARFYLAIALCQLQQFEAALEHYQQVNEPQISWGEAIVTQAQQQLGTYLQQQQQFEAAASIYRQILQRAEQFEARNQLGQILRQQGQYAEAIECYQQALAIESEPLQALWELSKLHQELGNDREAAGYQERALDIQPDARQYMELAQTYQQLQQPQKSIDCYRRALELEPLLEAYTGLGTLLQQHQPEAAVELYREAIALFEGQIELLGGLAQTYYQLQQWSEATALYTQIIQRYPNWIFFHHLGDSLIHQQQWQGAVEAYRTAIELNPESVWSYYNLTKAYAQLQQWEEVLLSQAQVSRIDPQFWRDNWTDPAIHQRLGDYFYGQQRYSEAETAYSRAVQNNGDYFQLHHQLGDTYLLQEQPQKAIACYARAIQLQPDYFWSHHNLGEAYAQLQQWSEAIAAYTEARRIQPDHSPIEQKLTKAYYEQIKASSGAAIAFYEHQLQQGHQPNPLYERIYQQLTSLLNLHVAADTETSPTYYLQQAQTHLKQQQWAGAIANYKQALHLEDQIDQTWLSETVGGIEPEPIKLKFDPDRAFTRDITVIIPVYNAYDDTQKCIYSVLENTKVQYDLLLIDDCSTDGRVSEFVEQIAQQYSHITCIQNPQNQGFVRTCNLAFAIAQGEDVVILNSDTVVTPGWLEKLERAAYAHPQIASVTPLTNNGEICSVPKWLEYNDLPENFTVESFGDLVEIIAIGRYPTIPTCVGFCTYIKREVFDRIGFFDEVSFGKGYGEENDWSIRAREAGYYHIVDDSTFVYHAGGKSFGVEAKEQLVLENFKPLQQLHPEYFEEIHQFIALKPYQEILTNIQLHLKLKTIIQQTPICFLLHNTTDIPVNGPLGGTEYHCSALIEQIRPTQPVYTLCYNSQASSLQLNIYLAEEVLRFEFPCELSENKNESSPEFRQLLVDLLGYFRPSLIHIHHLINLPIQDVHGAIKQLQIPYVITLHDYYLICPSFSLLDYQNQFCYDHKNEDYCRQCVQNLFDQGENLKAEWYQQSEKLLADASGLIAPSDTARFYYASEYPQYGEKMETIRHGILPEAVIEAYLSYKQAATNRAVSLPLKVGFVGGINEAKGLDIIIELLESVHSQPQLDSQLQFALYGATSKPLPESITNITIYERYQREDLPQLLESVDIVIFPGIWAETYCLVADEVLALGIPIIATPLGAVPERINQYGIGWITESSSAASLVELLGHLIDNPTEITRVQQQVAEYQIVAYETMAQQYMERYSAWRNSQNAMMPSNLAAQMLLSAYLQANLNLHSYITNK